MAVTKRRRELLEKLARLRSENQTFKQCSTLLGLSERHCRRLAQSDEFKEIFQELQVDAQGNARALAKLAAGVAVRTLIAVCQSGKLGQAQVMAAKTLGEWAGVPDMGLFEVEDDRQELIRLAELIRVRREERHLHLHVEMPREDSALPALPAGNPDTD